MLPMYSQYMRVFKESSAGQYPDVSAVDENTGGEEEEEAGGGCGAREEEAEMLWSHGRRSDEGKLAEASGKDETGPG